MAALGIDRSNANNAFVTGGEGNASRAVVPDCGDDQGAFFAGVGDGILQDLTAGVRAEAEVDYIGPAVGRFHYATGYGKGISAAFAIEDTNGEDFGFRR